MGQKKTWALHHVPYSMLWESMCVDYKFLWNTVLQYDVSDHFCTSQIDFVYRQNSFNFFWNCQYLNTFNWGANHQTYKKKTLVHKTENAKMKAPVFVWKTHAYKGKEEAFFCKNYLIKTNDNSVLLSIYFKKITLKKNSLKTNKTNKINKIKKFTINQQKTIKNKIKLKLPLTSKKKNEGSLIPVIKTTFKQNKDLKELKQPWSKIKTMTSRYFKYRIKRKQQKRRSFKKIKKTPMEPLKTLSNAILKNGKNPYMGI